MNRTLVWQLALRYMRGKRSANAVPILSRISMIAIAVSSCALIVLFSVFNGFENLIEDLYKAFYPDIRISAAKGKFFDLNTVQLETIKKVEGVQQITGVIQDNVLVNSEDGQIPVTLKGIDKNYFNVNDIKPYIVEGRDSLMTYPVPTAIVGIHIAANLGLDVNNVFNRLVVYYPNTSVTGSALAVAPESAFQSLALRPDGAFQVQEEFDAKYILADFALVQQLMRQPGKVSSIELKVDNTLSGAGSIREKIQKLLGPAYIVETRFEQNKSIYMVMRSEKWAGYAILLFVLFIASFNMVGALSMLVLEKQKDIAILKVMGAIPADISRIILMEGVLWSLVGGLIGLGIGLILCFCQYHFHWVRIEGSFIIDAYPIDVAGTDVLVVVVTVVIVGLLAALYPARQAAKGRLGNLTLVK